MTGLDLRTDALIEIAALVTDSDLNVLGDGVDVVIHADDEALANMPEVVRVMHERSGLTEQVRASTVTMEQAEKMVLDYIREFAPDPKTAPLAGNSIATDRGFISRDMPTLDAYLHYRMIDVSSIKELCRRWYPKVYYAAPEKHGGHRALADIQDSVAELRYYRSTIFTAEPGPDTTAARAAAGAAPGRGDDAHSGGAQHPAAGGAERVDEGVVLGGPGRPETACGQVCGGAEAQVGPVHVRVGRAAGW